MKVPLNTQLAKQLRRLCKKHGVRATVEVMAGATRPHLAIIDYLDREDGTILRFYNCNDVLEYLGY